MRYQRCLACNDGYIQEKDILGDNLATSLRFSATIEGVALRGE